MRNIVLYVVIGAVIAMMLGCADEKPVPSQPIKVEASQQHVSEPEKSEKEKAFDEHLSRKKAEFRRNMDEIKAENDEMRQKFDSL